MREDKKYVLQATYHNYNYGSVLQCFATQCYLKKKGFECYLVSEQCLGINRIYNAIRRRIIYLLDSIVHPEIKKEIKSQTKSSKMSADSITENSKRKIDVFFENNVKSLSLSWRQLKQTARKSNCEFCVAGSDQIWNAHRVFLDDIYFLRFASKCKRVALAPSFGDTIIPNYNKNKYKKRIADFSKISVREKSGKNIVFDMLKKEVPVLMDPVFLLSKEEWELSSDIGPLEAKYIFAFFLDFPSTKAIDKLKDYQSQGYVVYTVGYAHTSLNEIGCYFWDGGPADFLYLIRNSSIVVTDSFHATAFSTIFLKEFYVFRRNYQGTNQETRLIDYLDLLGLLYRYEPEKSVMKELTMEEKEKIMNIINENRYNTDIYLFG